MKFGIHLPQYGRAAGPDAISAVARQAEQLGFADVWASDHQVFPVGQSHPSPYLYDALLTLTWAAAATESVGLGTSVLVVSQHNPLQLANVLASLDSLSGGRLTIAVGVGWSEAEFRALGYEFADRGRRTDEILQILRTAWTDDVASFRGEHYEFADVRILPKPAHRVPIWIGGASEPAYRRAEVYGDGFQAINKDPAELAPTVERIRRVHPDSARFPISLRLDGWDPQTMDGDEIARQRVAYERLGVAHVVASPMQKTPEAWMRSVADLARILDL